MFFIWYLLNNLSLWYAEEGSRALLKWVKEGVVVHDASYYNAVQLEGPEAGISFFPCKFFPFYVTLFD